MGKKRLNEYLEYTEAEKIRRKKTALLGFPVLSIVIAAVTLAPPLILIINDRKLSPLFLIPMIFGAYMLFNGIQKLIVNRKEIAAAFSNKE